MTGTTAPHLAFFLVLTSSLVHHAYRLVASTVFIVPVCVTFPYRIYHMNPYIYVLEHE